MNWNKLLGWICTPVYVLSFFGVMLFFHVVQVLSRSLGGYHAHKKSVDYMLMFFLAGLRLFTAARVKLHYKDLPTDRPIIVVSNHQTMFDIVLLGVIFRKHHPKYVSKLELSKGIPSISYNLRHGGSVMIDRKDSRQAIPALKNFAEYINENKYAGCIFPEGTRAKDGVMKHFKPQGLSIMLKYAPDALIVPVAIEGSWELQKYNFKPVPFGCRLQCTILEPLSREGKTPLELVLEAENKIRQHLKQPLRENMDEVQKGPSV